jgi:serine/threonine protein kinase
MQIIYMFYLFNILLKNFFPLFLLFFSIRFLQNSKDGFQTSATTLGTRQLVEFGLQVAKGISHLHSLGVLHKDVATRNCV